MFFEYVSHFLPLFYSVSSFGRSYFDFFPNHFPFSVYLFIFGWPFIYAYRIYLVRVPGSNNTRQALRAPSPSIYRKHSTAQSAPLKSAKHALRADHSVARRSKQADRVAARPSTYVLCRRASTALCSQRKRSTRIFIVSTRVRAWSS